MLIIGITGGTGSGKTTTAGKLAKYFQKRGLKIALVQLDAYRPAAYEQLLQIGESINIPVFGDKNEKNALKIYKNFEEAKYPIERCHLTRIKNLQMIVSLSSNHMPLFALRWLLLIFPHLNKNLIWNY